MNEPKTYNQAIDLVIKSWDKDSLSIFRKSPLYIARWAGSKNNIEALKYINIKSKSIHKSCYKANGNEPVHFEDVLNFVMRGVWKKLNPHYPDFEKMSHKKYFESIYEIIKKQENNKIVDIASLPEWIYEDDTFDYTIDKQINLLRVQQAEYLLSINSDSAPIAALYLSHYNPDSPELLSWLASIYNNHQLLISLPSYKIKHAGNEYRWEKNSSKDFAVKCYGIKYNKQFRSIGDYEDFLAHCTNNYLAYWKYQNILAIDNYKELIQHPKKLLEILILSNHYFVVNHHNDELIYHSGTTTDALIGYMELDGPITLFNPYPKNINKYSNYELDYEITNPKALNALVKIADKLQIDELLSILEPEAKVIYNSTLKTDDFNDYNTLTGFLLATQYERLINYHDKRRVFKICEHYWTKEHISWPIKFFVTEILIRIDKEVAIRKYKEKFNSIDGDSFSRQGILRALIKYDFENQKDFIENWYWKVKYIHLNHSPSEDETILNALKSTDENTITLYNKITSDPRF